ncbi:MAG: NAD-dependent epimerase/dehydratase family protein [Elusimicrobiaceae bacterium]|nr:NAD-dependent epimerase/dehydratase family protein [Elusimicrobiaceae bacterium]
MPHTASFHFLITGGAGFIGSHLAKTLVTQGHRVSVLDNLSGGNLKNLAPLQDKIRFIQTDICDFQNLLTACNGVDYILHHAALGTVADSIAQPQETTRVNVQGTQNVLEAARQSGVKRVIFASSAAVYGTQPGFPYKEDAPADCHSPYAWSKQVGAQLCQLYTRIYGLETVVLRYFNVFGPGQNPHTAHAAVIAKFMQQAADNQPLGIDWDGLQSRDFINVKDIVQANLLATFKAVPGETYNVASDRTYTLLEVAKTVEKISGRKLERVFLPKRPGDVHTSAADIHKIRALGFTPTITLEEGLQEIWEKQFSALSTCTAR